jgi:AcrR family transcriptional regulator
VTTRDRILEAAQRLFAERGYARVSIRQIAAESGVSPALVMKLGGSKEQLYADATPPRQSPLSPDWPDDRVGAELVRRILSRRDDGAVEPWLQDLLAVVDSADPAAARADFATHYVARLTVRVAPGENQRERAELVAAMLLGLASAVRPLRLLDGDDEWVIERYGAMLQSLVDG